jgi:competence protein ComEC
VYAIGFTETRSALWIGGITALLAQRGRLILWVPVCLAVGIGIYFSLPTEPEALHYGILAVCVLAFAYGARLAGEAFAPLIWACVLVGMGVLVAGVRAHSVAAPVLEYRYYGPIEGRIVNIDRAASDKVRLTLDRVVLERKSPEVTPKHVRVSLHGEQGFIDLKPGMTVILTGHLDAPNGPVEPGGFDFGRNAWFDALGAVGYTRVPVLGLNPPENSLSLLIFRVRTTLSRAVQDRMPGSVGGFAAAIMTGDRSGIEQAELQALRDSNLAHLLAISGLHMGLLTGVVFMAIRGAIALVPAVALRISGKKVAAVVAIIAGAFYLALSGGTISTQRAFVMVCVMLVAVLLDRRAISLRAVAIAATIILIWRPDSLMGPGFQMSFAATTALVAVFGAFRENGLSARELPRWVQPVVAVFLSSAIAGAATAPYSAAHFNQIADYGLIANLLSVPLMGALVMPAAVAAAVLSLVGLEWIALEAMRWGLLWILGVAEWVAGLDGSTTKVISPDWSVLPIFTLGALFVILWSGRVRFAGLGAMTIACILWGQTERPDILISSSGGLVGVMTDAGRVVNKPKGDGFAARNWLENDGDIADQELASTRRAFDGKKGDLFFAKADFRLRHVSGRDQSKRVQGPCAYDVLVMTKDPEPPLAESCTVISPKSLRKTGAVAIYTGDNGVKIIAANDLTGARLWTHARLRRAQ